MIGKKSKKKLNFESDEMSPDASGRITTISEKIPLDLKI